MPVSLRPSALSTLAAIAVLALSAIGQQSANAFDAPTVVLGPLDPAFEALIDFDADGVLDAVGALRGGTYSTLGLYRNDGTGVFTMFWSAPGAGVVSPGYGEVIPADFDGDGRDDFVWVTGSSITAYLGNGFAAPTAMPSFTLPGPERFTRVCAADLDGDGHDDLVILTNQRFGILLTGPTPGSPTMMTPATPVAGTDACVVRHPDGTHSAIVIVLLANPPATGIIRTIHIGFTGQMAAPQSVFVNGQGNLAAGDVDGDGLEDAVSFRVDGSYEVVRQIAGNQFVLGPRLNGGPASGLADVDGDGDPDGIGGGGIGYSLGAPSLNANETEFQIAINQGGGVFAPAFRIPGLGSRRFASAADIDQDGDVDLVAGRAIYYARGPLAGHPFQPYPQGVDTYPMNMGSVDGDGDGDLDPGFRLPTTLLNDGAAGLVRTTFPTVNPLVAYLHSAPVDFDGDGDLDMLVSQSYPAPPSAVGISLATQTGPGVFTYGPLLLPPDGNLLQLDGSHRSLTLDIDHDGLDDCLLTTEFDLGWSTPLELTTVYRNLGGGSFAPGFNLPFTVKGTGDMDNDGFADLVVITTASGLGWVRTDGSLLLPAPQWFGVGGVSGRHDRIAVADLDGDGNVDVLAPSRPGPSAPPAVVLIRNLGNGVFTAVSGLFTALESDATPQMAKCVRVADLDRDGRMDVVVAPCLRASNAAGIHLGMGALAFAPARLQILNPELLADLDGDGSPDVHDSLRRYLNRCVAAPTPAPGVRLQFGAGGAGSGGIAPLLGAIGPFRPGEVVRVRIRGGIGAAPAIFAFSLAPLSMPEPFGTGQQIYIDPGSPATVLLPLTLGGPAAQVGAGTAEIPFAIPPGLSGITIYHQAAVADPAGSFGLSLTNALRITYGN